MAEVKREIDGVVTYKLGHVYQADCLEAMCKLPEGSIDAVVTDPPYNIGYGYDGFADKLDDSDYFAQQLEMCREASRVLSPGGSLLYLNLPEFAARMWAAVREDIPSLVPHQILAWCRHDHIPSPRDRLRKSFRLWLWFCKGEPRFNRSAVLGEYRNPTDKRVAKLIAAGKAPTWRNWFIFEPCKNVSKDKTNHRVNFRYR